MYTTIALALLSVFLITSLLTRAKVLDRIGARRRRATGSFTPPRSLSPEKQAFPPNDPPAPDYSNVFPAHRREALASLPIHRAEELSKSEPDQSNRASDKANVHAKQDASTATGFTVAEVESLGDFPDYATLSGVPLPEPVSAEFDIQRAKPRPYRPLRWAYHQTMSLTKMEPDWWLELESTYAARIAQRQGLYQKYGDAVLQALPGSEIATKELMEMCLQFYCARYPQYFRLSPDRTTFHNSILNATTDLTTSPPLLTLLNHVPEDFACMLRDPITGIYSFRAGIICSSLGWNVGSKIGLKLHEIHAPIPDYREKMQFSMDRYFARMPTDKPIQRGSWGLEIDEPLFMPPGDPHEKLREAQDPSHTIERCNLRVDWQTLRRLPLSGSIVFNFKAVFTPVTEFRDEPYIPSLLLKILREGKKSLMEYKNTWHTQHVVIPAMEEYEREQIANGMIEKDWEPHTLDESPYFRGWEEKWQRQQGFTRA